MSMTREEIIHEYEDAVAAHAVAAAAGIKGAEKSYELFKAGLEARRPVSREQVEKMRSRWVPLNNTQEHFCESCGVAFNLYAYCRNDYQFCPSCGAPMTDEAVEMVMERLNKLEETKK